MNSEMDKAQLVSLEDEQLDEVAGGWGRRGWWSALHAHHRQHHGFGGFGGFGGPDININIELNVANVVGNTLISGGDSVIAVDQNA